MGFGSTKHIGGNDASRWLYRNVGPDSALVLYGHLWLVIRYLDPSDKFFMRPYFDEKVGRMERRKVPTPPHQRQVEILAEGKTIDEAMWFVRNGTARTMVGRGLRPVLSDDRSKWVGFTDAQGRPTQTMPGGGLLS